ncbi:MAG: hypothetical protein GY791_19585 [Alphaproteobacteria bacterium]|nr:hypothetical protein [Alphaproteobacteria bacterium]
MRVSIPSAFVAIAGLALTAGCALIQGQVAQNPPEHYICSDFEVDERNVINPKRVTLQDQFGGINARVRLIKYLCAPAFKYVNGKYTLPKDFRGPHLACYELRRKDPDNNLNIPVKITNQFETRGLNGVVGNRQLLCVPSAKKVIAGDKDPEFDRDAEIKKVEAALNHFVCSDFIPRDEDPEHGRLDILMGDQFGPLTGPIDKPDFLCAPAKKTFDGKEKKPGGGFNATHLACYKFLEDRAVAFPKNVLVINQLDRVPQRGKPIKRYMFCVPSEKTRL